MKCKKSNPSRKSVSHSSRLYPNVRRRVKSRVDGEGPEWILRIRPRRRYVPFTLSREYYSDLNQRRRTQIRLAQRAYRQRKETTISGLKRRVSALESAVQSMNRNLLKFQDQAVASGLQQANPELAQQLQTAVDETVRLAQEVNRQHESVPSEEDSPLLPPEESAHDKPAEGQGQEQQQQSEDPQWAFDPDWNPEAYSQSFSSYPQIYCAQFPELPCLPRVPFPKPAASLPQIPLSAPSLPTDLPSPSYAHKESSFTRRLLRLAIQYQLSVLASLPSSSSPPPVYAFTASFFTRDKIIWCLETLLSSPSGSNLEVWSAPLYHIGGSGLHYPRNGIDEGTNGPPGWWSDPGFTGPFPPRAGGDKPMDELVRDFGLEGPFFDPNDVEEYLKAKGLDLDATRSLVELRDEGNLWEQQQSKGKEKVADLATYAPPDQDSFDMNDLDRDVNMGGMWPATISMPILTRPLSPQTTYPAVAPPLKTPSQRQTETLKPGANTISAFDPETQTPSRKVRRWMDVDAFISSSYFPPQLENSICFHPLSYLFNRLTFYAELITSCVCLGRTTGFRPSVVEEAFETSILLFEEGTGPGASVNVSNIDDYVASFPAPVATGEGSMNVMAGMMEGRVGA